MRAGVLRCAMKAWAAGPRSAADLRQAVKHYERAAELSGAAPKIKAERTHNAVACRSEAEAMEQAESGSDTAIFTSGGTIATAVSWVLGVPHDRIYGFYEPVFNCSITRLIFSRGRVSLSNFNDTAHLQLLSQQLGETLVTYR